MPARKKSTLISVAALLFAWIFLAYVSVWGIPDLFSGALRGAMPHKLGFKNAIMLLQIEVLNATSRTHKFTQSVRNTTEESHMIIHISAQSIKITLWIILTIVVLVTNLPMM